MGTPRGTGITTGQHHAYSSTYLTVSPGKVILAYGASTLRISGFLRSPQGNFSIKPRYRKFKVRPDKPDTAAWTDGTAVSGDGAFSEDFSLSGLGNNLWIQPAIGGATSGSAGEGFVSWQAFTDSTARLVARQTVVLTGEEQPSIISLGSPFPALGLAGVMIAVVATSLDRPPIINFVPRSFAGDLSEPDNWGADIITGGHQLSSANEEYNTGDQALSGSGVGYQQIGLKINPINGAPVGNLDILVAVRYS